MPQEDETRSLSAHLPPYREARHFIRLADGLAWDDLREMERRINEQTGTPQDQVDWSEPGEWIPERLSGAARQVATHLWDGSGGDLNPRHTHHARRFAQKHQLLERARGEMAITERGRRFLEGDITVIAAIDRYEAIFVLLSLLPEDAGVRFGQLLPDYSAFLRARTTWRSDSAVRMALRARLANLVDREFVISDGRRYYLTEEGREYLEQNRSMVESIPGVEPEAPEAEEEKAQRMATERPLPSVAELFHRVERLLPLDEASLTLEPDTTVAEAIAIMREHNVHQLPVVAGPNVLGLFSLAALAENLVQHGRISRPLGEWPVDEFLEPAAFYHRSDSWESILGDLHERHAILVGHRERLEGMVTALDVVDHLRQVANPFVMLAEIERSLRRIIRARVTPEELTQMIARSLESAYPEGHVPDDLTDMSFNDYVNLITTRDHWPHFAPVFGDSDWARKRTNSRLIQIRQLRNVIFHFRRELEDEERQKLARFRNWLETQASAYEGLQGA